MGEQLKEDHTLWVKLLTESKSPLEKLLVDHEVGRVEFERFEGAVDYENNSITGTWAVKFAAMVFTLKWLSQYALPAGSVLSDLPRTSR